MKTLEQLQEFDDLIKKYEKGTPLEKALLRPVIQKKSRDVHPGIWRIKGYHTLGFLTAPESYSRIGVMEFPAVSNNNPSMIVEVHITRSNTEDDIFADGCTEEQKKHCLEVLNIIRNDKKSVPVHIQFSDYNWNGKSFSFAFALAFLSLKNGIPLLSFLASGKILEGKLIGSVDRCKEKYELKKKLRPFSYFLVPKDHNWKENDRLLCSFPSLDNIWQKLSQRTPLADQLSKIADHSYRREWKFAAENARILLENNHNLSIKHTLQLLGISLRAANNERDTNYMEDAIHRIKQIQQKENIENLEDDVLLSIYTSMAISYLDQLQPQEGMKTLKELPRKKKRLTGRSRIQYYGTKVRLLFALGKRKKALTLLEKNIDYCRTSESEELPRCLGDLGETLRKMKEYEQSHARLQEAEREYQKIKNIHPKYSSETLTFIRLYQYRLARVQNTDNYEGLDFNVSFPSINKHYRLCKANSLEELNQSFTELFPDPKPLHSAYLLRHQYLFVCEKEKKEIHKKLQYLSNEWAGLELDEIILRIPYVF